MAISLKSLNRVTATQPPRIMIYGPPGIGKTSLAAEFPGTVFVQIEDGTPGGIELDTFGILKSFGEVMEALTSLLNEEHEFNTVAIDSVDKLEPHVWAQTCEDNKWANIEAPGYGKGYLGAETVWREYLALCAELRSVKKMAVIHLAHSAIERFDDPQTASYSRHDLRLQKRAIALFQDEMDAIFFMNQDVSSKVQDAGFNKKEHKGVGGGSRWIYAEGRPSFVAKNRYGLPDKLLYTRGSGYQAIAPYFPCAPEGVATKQAAE